MEAVRPEVRRATTSFCMVPAGRHSLAAITTYSAKQPPDRVATGCPTSNPASYPHHNVVCNVDSQEHRNHTDIDSAHTHTQLLVQPLAVRFDYSSHVCSSHVIVNGMAELRDAVME